MLNLATQKKSPDHYAKGTRSGDTGSEDPGTLPALVGTWFQVLFHSPLGVLFTFPSRYLFTIGRRHVFSLGRWSSRFPAGFHVSRGTQEPDKGASLISPTGLAPCIADHSRSFGYEIGFLLPGATAVTPCPVLQHPECNAGRLMHTRGLG